MSRDWRADLDLALEVAWEAGRVTLRWFQADPAVETKADGSPVTIADRDAERLAREILGRRRPEDGVLGEEWGVEREGASRRWILDPIDGTRSFVHGVPLYGVMVALEADGEPVVGVLHFPALGETVAAARGLGCRWNGRPCRVSGVGSLANALVVTSGDARTRREHRPPPGAAADARDFPPPDPPSDPPSDPGLPDRVSALDRIGRRAGTFRTWGDCYGYALVATGRAEAMLDPVLNVWDAAAVRPVIEEAGGVFTDWAGTRSHESGHAVGTNRALADEVRRVLDSSQWASDRGRGPSSD